MYVFFYIQLIKTELTIFIHFYTAFFSFFLRLNYKNYHSTFFINISLDKNII